MTDSPTDRPIDATSSGKIESSTIPEVMNEKTLCVLLEISPTTAWRLRRKKKLGYCTEAGKVWYLRRHVLEFLAACEIKASWRDAPHNIHLGAEHSVLERASENPVG